MKQTRKERKGHVRFDFEAPDVKILKGPDLEDISTAQDHSMVSSRRKPTFTPVKPSPVPMTVVPQLPQNLTPSLVSQPDLPKMADCQSPTVAAHLMVHGLGAKGIVDELSFILDDGQGLLCH